MKSSYTYGSLNLCNFKREASFIVMLFVAALFSATADARVLKVLAIGNSFSEDALEQNLWELAAEQGDTLVIGNAYIGGCPIERHLNNIRNGKPAYSYRKVVDGKKTTRDKVALKDIVQDERWDIISLQQASPLSGKPESYSGITELKDRVKAIATNPSMEIVFYMTWAYAPNSTHEAFKNYGRSQDTMYNAILGAVKNVQTSYGIKRIVPGGAAVQLMRRMTGDYDLTRDGYHMSIPLGRYLLACTWCEFVTGKKVTRCKYRPSGLDEATAATARKAAHKAFSRKAKAAYLVK